VFVVLALCCAGGGTASHHTSHRAVKAPAKAPPKVAKVPRPAARRHHAAAHAPHRLYHHAPPPAAPVEPVSHVTVGIGDNKTEFLTDPRFLALRITHIRDDVPWDVLADPFARARLALWLGEARREHLIPLISFDRSGLPGLQRTLPSVAEYSRLFLEFRALYPWVKEFVTWDEANFFLEPTARHPRRAAAYYLALRRDCPSCTILAVDLLDLNGDYGVPMVEWAREFMRHVPSQPAYWGLNNYVGANSLTTASTQSLLNAVTGKIWFAETAGVISDGAHAVEATASRLDRQASVDRFILGPLASLSPRIKRVYLYEWNAQTSHDDWDSALVSSNGVPRPAYYALADVLDSWGIKPDCSISMAPPACSAGAPTAG
jgi:hypothetical protein